MIKKAGVKQPGCRGEEKIQVGIRFQGKKNTSGIYIRFIHQFSVLEQDRNGRSWLALIITEIMPGKASDRKPKRRMINIENGTFCLFLEDGENSAHLLTPREAEILKLINQGFDSGQIADTLFISVNTVNNHRQNILRKTGSMDTTHAFLYAKKIGII